MNIDQLEQQLHTLKTKATLTKIDKAEMERLKQLIKSAYADSKATVVTFEKPITII